MPRKIAFIRRGSFSHINAIVGEMLRKHFPEHEVEITDVDEILKRNKGMRLCYLLHIFKIYGWRSLASSMKFPEKLPA